MKVNPQPARSSSERVTLIVTVIFIVMAFIAAALGFFGFRLHLARPTVPDLLYYTGQLFVLGAKPLEDGGPFPWPLEVARLLAPTATLTALGVTFALLLRQTAERSMAALSRRHAIVVGDSDAAILLARRLHEEGHRVVMLRSMPTKIEGVLTIAADLRDPQSLTRCALSQARIVFAMDEDGATNLIIASNVIEALQAKRRRHSRSISVHVLVNDTVLCSALNADHLRSTPQGDTHISFFHLDEIAAAQLVATHPPTPIDGKSPNVFLAELTPFGCALLVEIARWWGQEGRERISVIVADPGKDPEAVLADICMRYPQVEEKCKIEILRTSPNSASQKMSTIVQDHLKRSNYVYLCGNQEQVALRHALSVVWTVAQNARRIIVRADRQTGFGEVLQETPGGLFGTLGHRVQIFGVLENACKLELLKEDIRERLAQAIHHKYLRERRSQGDKLSSRPEMAPWSSLPETFRAANRAQAERMGASLMEHNIYVVPYSTSLESFSFTSEELESLAIREHLNWMSERKRDGWQLGEVRDDAKKTHPSMIPWEDLSESAKDKDREAVLAFPQVLAIAGYHLLRGRKSSMMNDDIDFPEEGI